MLLHSNLLNLQPSNPPRLHHTPNRLLNQVSEALPMPLRSNQPSNPPHLHHMRLRSNRLMNQVSEALTMLLRSNRLLNQVSVALTMPLRSNLLNLQPSNSPHRQHTRLYLKLQVSPQYSYLFSSNFALLL